MQSGQLLREYRTTEQPLVYVSALAALGEHIVSCGSDGLWQLWKTGETSAWPLDEERCAEVSSEDKLRLASRTLYQASEPLWCTAIVGTTAFAGCRNGFIYATDIYNNGSNTGTIGHELGWTTGETDTVIDTMEGHRGAVQALAVVREQLVSSSSDCTIRLWWVDSKICVRVLCGHSNDVVALCVRTLPSGEDQIISSSHDGQVLGWSVSQRCPHKCHSQFPLSTRAAEQEMLHHVEHLCGNRPVPCPNLCSVGNVVAGNLTQHLASDCELRPVECPSRCGAEALLAMGLRAHMETMCPRRSM